MVWGCEDLKGEFRFYSKYSEKSLEGNWIRPLRHVPRGTWVTPLVKHLTSGQDPGLWIQAQSLMSGSELSAQSPTRGSNPRTARS